jgi:Putative GTPase activating protein for Arf
MSSADDCEMNRQDYEFLQSLPGNATCVDCGAPHPDWGSPTFGILFCFQCSGQHRYAGARPRSSFVDAPVSCSTLLFTIQRIGYPHHLRPVRDNGQVDGATSTAHEGRGESAVQRFLAKVRRRCRNRIHTGQVRFSPRRAVQAGTGGETRRTARTDRTPCRTSDQEAQRKQDARIRKFAPSCASANCVGRHEEMGSSRCRWRGGRCACFRDWAGSSLAVRGYSIYATTQA